MTSPLILLHGALGYAGQFQNLKTTLATQFPVYPFTFSGHGNKPFSDEGFTVSVLVEEVVAFANQANMETFHLFGHSLGGYVALCLAHRYPHRVKSLFTLGTKFDWTPEGAAREVAGLNPQKIKDKVPHFARLLEERHGKDLWEVLLAKTGELMTALGHAPLVNKEMCTRIACPVTIGIGSADALVTVEESERVAGWLPHGKLHVFEGMQHPIEKADVEEVSRVLKAGFDPSSKNQRPFA